MSDMTAPLMSDRRLTAKAVTPRSAHTSLH